MSSGLLSLKWNNHRSTFFHVLSSIRSKESYCDATLACDGRFYPVHKLVLSTCSEYFEQIFERTQCKHPVIVLKDIKYDDLEALMNYMYVGEVNVLQEKLASLIKAAECLKIKGLAVPDEDPTNNNKRYSGRVEAESPHAKRRRREDSINHEERERNSASNRPRQSQRDQLPQVDAHINSTQVDQSSSNNSKSRLENISQRIGDVESEYKQHNEEVTDDHSAKIISDESDGRLSSRKPVPEVSIDDTSVKSEPPDIQDEIVDDSKEALHTDLGYDPLEDTETVNANPASVASGSSETPYSDSNLMDSTPQSVEDVVAQALPHTSSSFQGNSFSMWEGEGSLQNLAGEGFSGENSQGRSMFSREGSFMIPKVNLNIQASTTTTSKYPQSVSPTSQASFDVPNITPSNFSFADHRHSKEASSHFRPSLFCRLCKMEFKSLLSFKLHQQMHSKSKQYSCPHCSYKSFRKQDLSYHFRTHTGEKPYSCPFCSQKFSVMSNMKAHIRRKHSSSQTEVKNPATKPN